LRAVWLDCLDRHSARDPQGLCSRAREPADVVIRVLPGPTPNALFGIAFLPALASVYCEYAVRLAKSGNAHDSGVRHCARGRSSTAWPEQPFRRGIMRGEWRPKELQLALMGRLLFASQQAKVIRAEARRRMNLQTGTPKEQHLATVDPRGELIPQSD
jgi:hypothetical protein